MKIKLALILSLLAGCISPAFAEPASNFITNPGFENGKGGWTASAGTFTITGTAANVARGNWAASWDASASSQTLSSTQYTIPSGLFGRNCLADILYKGGDANLTLEVYDGTNVVASQVLATSTNYVEAQTTFLCPSSGTIALRLKSSADAAVVYMDETYLGPNFKVGTVTQATMYGSSFWLGTASCTWTNATTWTNFAADTDCPTPTLTGNATAVATKIPAIKFATLPPGEYEVVVHGNMTEDSACDWRISDGTNTSAAVSMVTGDGEFGNVIIGRFSYTVAQSDITFNVQSNRPAAGNCYLQTDSAGRRDLALWVKQFPSASQTAIAADVSGWQVDAKIDGANPSLTDQATYTGITNASLTLTNATNGYYNLLPAFISCSSTEDSSGNTCSGDEELGFSFTVPTAGDVKVCAQFPHHVSLTGGAASVDTWFQLVETANTSQTITQIGNSVAYDRVEKDDAGSQPDITHPINVCGMFHFSSAGKKTVRLFYAASSGGTPTSRQAAINVNLNGTSGLHFHAAPANQVSPAPILVGSVVGPTSGIDKIVRFNFADDTSDQNACDNSPCVVYQSNISGISVTRSGTGVYPVTWPAGTFSGTPHCVVTSEPGGYSAVIAVTGVSSTGITVRTFSNTTDTASDQGNDAVVCIGPR